MAQVKFHSITQAILKQFLDNATMAKTVFGQGAIIFTTDTNRIYWFPPNGESLELLSDSIRQVEKISDLPETGTEGQIYYAKTENILCIWNGTGWSQINPDTGATSITVTGEGNAVTGASYDPTSRKITLNKGATYATPTELSTAVASAQPEVYQVTSDSTDIDTITADITAKAGDLLIVTSSTGIKSAYQYDKEDEWVACDGNVDATKVILKDNITLAGSYTQVGNITKSSATATGSFATKGKSVEAALVEIFSKRLQPATPTEPAVTVTSNQVKAYEVGTKVTPSYTASLSAGSYTYGPATGITAKTWSVTFAGATLTTATGTFAEMTVGDSTNNTISATATYDAGAIAKDNLGDNSNPVKQIAAGSKSKSTGAITGYRSYFYGILSSSSADAPLTSALVRGLSNGGAYNSSKTFTINANSSAKRIVIAIPSSSTRSGLSSVILTSAMNTPVTDSYPKTAKAVKVEGVDGYTAVDYDVYVYEPSKIDAGEVHKVTLA